MARREGARDIVGRGDDRDQEEDACKEAQKALDHASVLSFGRDEADRLARCSMSTTIAALQCRTPPRGAALEQCPCGETFRPGARLLYSLGCLAPALPCSA